MHDKFRGESFGYIILLVLLKNIRQDDINYVRLFSIIHSKGTLLYHIRCFYDREIVWQGRINFHNRRDSSIHPLQIRIFFLLNRDRSHLLEDERVGTVHNASIANF
jgi:hypothetical protein